MIPGTRVRIRSWQELVEKYGVGPDGNIAIPGDTYFDKRMQVYCEKVCEITDHCRGVYSISLDWQNEWSWTPEMFDIIDQPEPAPPPSRGDGGMYDVYRIKPLQWVELSEKMYAHTIIGSYFIYYSRFNVGLTLRIGDAITVADSSESLEAAKLAAERDYLARITTALEKVETHE